MIYMLYMLLVSRVTVRQLRLIYICVHMSVYVCICIYMDVCVCMCMYVGR